MPRHTTEKNTVIIRILVLILALTGCTHAPRYTAVDDITIVEAPKVVRPLPRPIPNRKEIVIALDAGHGGEDFGAHSNTKPKYHEKNLNLTLTKMVKAFLEQQGFRTEMIRHDDTFISLDDRAKMANARQVKLFVSLHFNSAPSKEADGIEVYYYKSQQNKERTDASRRLATAILEKVIDKTKAKSRGVKHGDYAVIRQTQMPAVLVEGGFLTNDAEMEKIKDPDYMKQLALGVAIGVQEYVNKSKL